MAVFTKPEDYQRALVRLARAYPDAIVRGVDAIIQEDMLKHAKARHPRRMSRKQRLLIMFKSIAMRKAGKKTKPGLSGRRFQSWSGGGGLVGAIFGAARKVRGMGVIGQLEARSPYAVYVARGTSGSAPHPFLYPAIKENMGKLRLKLQVQAAKWAKRKAGLAE